MAHAIRRFLLFEGATFVAASLVHRGVLVGGYEHGRAVIAETVIATVLLGAWALTFAQPAWTRGGGLAAQGFALLGTIVGLITIAVGVGPRTVPDVIYHVAIVAVLAWGLGVARRARGSSGSSVPWTCWWPTPAAATPRPVRSRRSARRGGTRR